MAGIKRGVMIASTMLLVAMALSACNQPYSQAPSVTNTPIDPGSLFATAITEPTGMSDVEKFATETALAANTALPGFLTETPIGITPQTGIESPTPIVAVNPPSTPTATLAVSGSTLTPVPSGPRPATYTLQPGEFPYCIARRFNVDPDELLSINSISGGTIYYAGLALKIPQTGNPFPGNRMLRNHPATYTVASSDETIYGIACIFGDIDPATIAQENGISAGAALTAGQQLRIP
jgi:LysM repeat protein